MIATKMQFMVEELYNVLGMRLLYMDALSHDLHAAYVSHISHITSFALANTVLEKEREEDAIFEMAMRVLKVR
jgi:prephenate dehydrogenase